MSGTPRTDAFKFTIFLGKDNCGQPHAAEVVTARFAVRLERELNESHAREAQLRAALDAPPHDTQHVECVCYGKNPTQVQVGYICNKCKALTLPAPPVCQTCNDHGMIGGHTGQTPETFDQWDAPCPDCAPQPVVPVEDVKPLVEALRWASNEAKGRLPDWFHSALSTFTAKHKL